MGETDFIVQRMEGGREDSEWDKLIGASKAQPGLYCTVVCVSRTHIIIMNSSVHGRMEKKKNTTVSHRVKERLPLLYFTFLTLNQPKLLLGCYITLFFRHCTSLHPPLHFLSFSSFFIVRITRVRSFVSQWRPMSFHSPSVRSDIEPSSMLCSSSSWSLFLPILCTFFFLPFFSFHSFDQLW